MTLAKRGPLLHGAFRSRIGALSSPKQLRVTQRSNGPAALAPAQPALRPSCDPAIWISLKIGSDGRSATRLFMMVCPADWQRRSLRYCGRKVPPELGDFVLHFAINTVWISCLLHGCHAGRWQKLRPRTREMKDIAAEPLWKFDFCLRLRPASSAAEKGCEKPILKFSSSQTI